MLNADNMHFLPGLVKCDKNTVIANTKLVALYPNQTFQKVKRIVLYFFDLDADSHDIFLVQ